MPFVTFAGHCFRSMHHAVQTHCPDCNLVSRTQETRGALHCNFRSLPCSALLYLMFALNRVGTVTGPFDVFITCSPFQLASPFPFLKKKKKTRTPRPSQSALGAASAAAQ